MDLELTGKRALITGSSSGIGRGIATVLAAEGVEVVVHGRSAERAEAVARAIKEAGGKAHVVTGDLTSETEAAAVVADVQDALGHVDILINNVGGNEAAGGGLHDWFSDTPEIWNGIYAQNVIAPVRMVHAFVPAMRERGWGRVINISSGGGAQPTPTTAAYCAAKAAINNMTVSLSFELARSGVTVNTISPGCTRTEGFENRTLTHMAAANGWPDDVDEREARFMALDLFNCTTQRFGRPEDIGMLAAFLASPHGAFVNGANYRIDGGQVQAVN